MSGFQMSRRAAIQVSLLSLVPIRSNLEPDEQLTVGLEFLGLMRSVAAQEFLGLDWSIQTDIDILNSEEIAAVIIRTEEKRFGMVMVLPDEPEESLTRSQLVAAFRAARAKL